MKKKISIIIFILMCMITTTVFATAKSADVKMEVVEDNVCTVKFNDDAAFEKKIIEKELDKHQVTLQLKVNNNAKRIVPSGEMILVIDSSSSMNDNATQDETRKDLVLKSANKLVENLLKINSTSLKIGVVTFSTGTEKDSNGYLATGTEKDAQLVCDFSNDVNVLKNKISAIEGTGPYTNLDSGIKLAKKQYTSENNNKYMIILTDGLPNLAVGYNDLVSYDGLTDVINETKSTITSLENIQLITMLTGIDNEEATFRKEGENTYTYGEVIQNVFGTVEKPTKGKFYKISDSEIEKTITDKIYSDLLPIENSLKDIVIKDYFPQYIVDNFEMEYVEGTDTSNVSSEIDKESNSITWNISELEVGKTAIIQYRLTLKDKFDEKIIDQILNTNEKVDITYKDFDGSSKVKSTEKTPKIKLTNIEVPIDNTVVPTPIPKAGFHTMIIGLMCSAIAVSMFLGYKYNKMK